MSERYQSTHSISIDHSRVDFALSYYAPLRRLSEYVDKNLTSPFLLEDAAAEIGISASRLSHLFAEKTGTRFSLWLRHRRIELATNLLSQDSRSISEVAAAVGFDNVRTFQRSFKRTLGVTPSRFREKSILKILSEQ